MRLRRIPSPKQKENLGGIAVNSQKVTDELRKLLQPFIKEHPMKKDTVYEEDVEDLIDFAQAFQVEKELLETVKANPDGVFWDFFRVIPKGVPPGQEDILDDWDDE